MEQEQVPHKKRPKKQLVAGILLSLFMLFAIINTVFGSGTLDDDGLMIGLFFLGLGLCVDYFYGDKEAKKFMADKLGNRFMGIAIFETRDTLRYDRNKQTVGLIIFGIFFLLPLLLYIFWDNATEFLWMAAFMLLCLILIYYGRNKTNKKIKMLAEKEKHPPVNFVD